MLEEKNNPRPLSELGEFELIKHLTERFEIKNSSTKLGIGDDAAILNIEKKSQLISTDLLVEGVHFDLLYTPLKHLGYKAVVTNLSDIYAMNAKPEQITVSLALSNRMSIEALEELYEGIALACELYGVDLIGGDTSSSNSGLVISVTAIGSATENEIVKRSGAKENDLICVSGDLGAAYMGLHLLEREKTLFNENSQIQPDFSGQDYLLERQLKPEARKDIIAFFSENNLLPTSMIDVSDGLSSELIHIAKQSKCGVQIYQEKLPIDPITISTAEEFKIDPYVAALNGGEDYELLFTVPIDQVKLIKSNKKIRIIGHVVDQASGCNMVASGSEQLIPLSAQGWNHTK